MPVSYDCWELDSYLSVMRDQFRYTLEIGKIES